MKKDNEKNKMENKYFDLKSEHIKLIENMNVSWWNAEYGAPCIDPKRPYGNSDVEEDICEILGFKKIEVDYEEKFLTKDLEYAAKIHEEMETALQVVLSSKSFEPGRYQCEKYGYKWEKFQNEKRQ